MSSELRFGLIGRSENRGLGNQSVSVCQALRPERVLLVEPRPASWPQHSDRYEGFNVTDVAWKQGALPEGTVRRWFEGLDCAYVAESVYDRRLPFWAAEAGCAVVRHVNPEQLGPEEIIDGDPTCWWAATPWRLEHLPAGMRVVPMPVSSPLQVSPNLDGPVRFLHSVGHVAAEDRAGTQVFANAVKRVKVPCRVDVFCQDRRLDVGFRAKHPGVDVRVRECGVDDQWEQYRGSDVLVLPRRYGGLSLPSLEAMAAGLALVMPDCAPNRIWPGPKVSVLQRRQVRMRCGMVEVCDPDPLHLAVILDELARCPDEVAKWQAESRAWAEVNSWEALRPLWLEELRRACGATSAAGEHHRSQVS